MRKEPRSGCPISLSLEVFGDRWTLLVLRDIMFGNRRNFRQLLDSEEGISSNILADRLGALVTRGLLTRTGDPNHKLKVTYSLTEQAIELVPIFAQVGAWGLRHLLVSRELGARMEILSAGGPTMWDAFMDELRETHLGPAARLKPAPEGLTVRSRMQTAFNKVATAP